MNTHFFVTGAMGCIGAWVVRNLVNGNTPVTVFDLDTNPHRLRLMMSNEALTQVKFVSGDITDYAVLERALRDCGATHIVHLAGLQVPFCRADPALGARVNVVGTVNMFEAAKRAGIKHLSYASSIGVFGFSEEYPSEPIKHEGRPIPHSHYGVYKLANEGTASVYWADEGISSVGLRPYVVYGPGRDQGMTSTPTKAMFAAAAGKPYHISYGGRFHMQHADDTAQAFIRAATVAHKGAPVLNLHGSVVHQREVVAAIEAAVPSAAGTITFDPKPLPLPEEFVDERLAEILGPLPYTPLNLGVAHTIEIFQRAIANDRVDIKRYA
jgi:nucleoside-diphosphate-sugar epimerase